MFSWDYSSVSVHIIHCLGWDIQHSCTFFVWFIYFIFQLVLSHKCVQYFFLLHISHSVCVWKYLVSWKQVNTCSSFCGSLFVFRPLYSVFSFNWRTYLQDCNDKKVTSEVSIVAKNGTASRNACRIVGGNCFEDGHLEDQEEYRITLSWILWK
jgi:hypothetical protein